MVCNKLVFMYNASKDMKTANIDTKLYRVGQSHFKKEVTLI